MPRVDECYGDLSPIEEIPREAGSDSFRLADYPGASGARLLSDLVPHRL